jgi:hypothetical protein
MENAINSKARDAAKTTGISPGDLVMRFHYQRLLARIFQQDGWMLKGGQSLLVRYPGRARASRDADLFLEKADDIEAAIAALAAAVAVDLDDYFRFTVEKSTVKPGGNATVQIGVEIGSSRKAPLNVDLVIRQLPTGKPTPVRMEPAVPVDWPDTWPEILLYPLVDHTADKICAMYEKHPRPGDEMVASSRFRDLGDLLLIAQQEPIDGRAVQIALASEVDRRTAAGTVLILPAAFEVPDQDSWARGYPKEAAKITGLRGCRTLAEAVTAAELFVTPLLSSADPGVWSPEAFDWTGR